MQTKDFYLSAFLLTTGHKLLDHSRKNGMTTFLFESDDEIDDIVSDYYSMNQNVEPISYSNSVRTLKSIIHSYTTSTSNRGYNNESNNKHGEQF